MNSAGHNAGLKAGSTRLCGPFGFRFLKVRFRGVAALHPPPKLGGKMQQVRLKALERRDKYQDELMN
jgi:hypothetical protein